VTEPGVPVGEDAPILEVMATMRAMRRLKPDPVPDEMLQKLVQAASWAPNAGNAQAVEFIIATDRALMKRLAGLWARSVDAYLGGIGEQTPALLLLKRARRLGLLAEASSVYPGVQNLLLAARALGLGAVITIWHLMLEQEWKKELAIPKEISTLAVIPIGWPRGRFGPVTRRPATDLIHRERW
jgi:nitroreductase